MWNLLFFVFNGAAFVLIGLQLRTIVRGLSQYSLATLIGWSLAVALVVVLVRYRLDVPGDVHPARAVPGDPRGAKAPTRRGAGCSC